MSGFGVVFDHSVVFDQLAIFDDPAILPADFFQIAQTVMVVTENTTIILLGYVHRATNGLE